MSTPNRREYGDSASSTESSYIIWKDDVDSRVYARNGRTGINDYQDTDASKVFNNVLASLTDGGVILVKKGTYTLSTGLSSNNSLIGLVGEAKESTILSAASGLTADLLTVNGVGSSIRNLTFDGANSTGGSLITAGNTSNTTRLTIADCNCINPSVSGINLRSLAGVCFVYGNRIQTFFSPVNKSSSGSGIALTGNSDGHVFHNDVGGFKSAAGIILNNTDNFDIIGNQIYVNKKGIDNYLPKRARIIGNDVQNNDQMGIRCFADLAGTWKGTTIIGNVVRANSQSPTNTQDGIQLATSGGNTISEIIVQGNILDDTQGTPTQRYGISVADTGVQNSIIADNICLGNVSGGVLLSAIGTGLSVRNNTGYNPQGWAVISPSIPASGVDQQNTTGSPVIIYITGVGTGITVVGITDNASTLQSFTRTGEIGDFYRLEVGDKIRLTYTGSPTWKWYGQ